MDKFLRPCDLHLHSFFLLTSIAEHKLNSLIILINYVPPEVFDYNADCTDYDSALETPESLCITPKNEIFAQHLSATR